MTFIKRGFALAIPAFFILAWVCVSAAAPDDGFGQAKKIEGKHFTIYYSPPSALPDLVRQLNITPSDVLLAGASDAPQAGADVELAQGADALFSLVCDFLDMQLYSYKGKIKICLDERQLDTIYKDLFGKDPAAAPMGSFYVSDLNAIYITQESFKRLILGHEIAHAVISNYFVVQPPIKVQEILAGYVEYQLRKTTS